jgi:hypothetical protein
MREPLNATRAASAPHPRPLFPAARASYPGPLRRFGVCVTRTITLVPSKCQSKFRHARARAWSRRSRRRWGHRPRRAADRWRMVEWRPILRASFEGLRKAWEKHSFSMRYGDRSNASLPTCPKSPRETRANPPFCRDRPRLDAARALRRSARASCTAKTRKLSRSRDRCTALRAPFGSGLTQIGPDNRAARCSLGAVCVSVPYGTVREPLGNH